MSVSKVTPIRIVEAIEPLLDLWERLGFTRAAAVPEGDRLGFVLLVRGASEVMLQTRASVETDLPAVAALQPTSVLYVEVDALSETPLDGVRVLAGPRTTFYGKREVVVLDAASGVIVFAEPVKEASHAG
jgi:hypothetical protein